MTVNEEKRYSEIRNTSTPEELSWQIWTKGLEDAMQSSRDCYRIPFVKWINEYVNAQPHTGWNYKTPRALAEDIWRSFRSEDDPHFENLRCILVEWIENYKTSKKEAKQ